MLAPTLAQQAFPATRPAVRAALLVATGTLLMALCARIAIPLPWTPIPMTMQTFGVLLIGALYGPRLGMLTMLVYLAEALLGLPVLSYGRSAWTPDQLTGLPVIIGSTAGYLYAMPLAAGLVGWLATRTWDRHLGTSVGAMLLGNALILVGGFCWLAAVTVLVRGGVSLVTLFNAAVLPFLAGDIIKLVLAAVFLPSGWILFKRSQRS